MSKQQSEQIASVVPFRNATSSFDPIKACEGYLAGFEAQNPEEASPSYLHGWRKGWLDARRPSATDAAQCRP